ICAHFRNMSENRGRGCSSRVSINALTLWPFMTRNSLLDLLTLFTVTVCIIFCISQLMIKSVLKDTGHGLLMNFVAFTLRIRWLWTLNSLILKRQITNSGYDGLNFIGAMAFSQLQSFSKRKKSLFKF